jgi:hypothetical protein
VRGQREAFRQRILGTCCSVAPSAFVDKIMNALQPRLTPIAACICAAFALASHSTNALANTVSVAQCTEASLRNAVNAAVSNDTVSLTALSTCKITLNTAAIAVNVTNLTILGPSANTVTIDGAKLNRAFNHTKSGTLTIEHMVLTDGKYNDPNAVGGCIRSTGSVVVQSSDISGCKASPTIGTAKGGAIYAKNKIKITDSTLTSNIAEATSGAFGGALYAATIDIEHSTLNDNHAQIPDGFEADSTNVTVQGGALWSKGALTVNNSIFTGDKAIGPNTAGGGVYSASSAYVGSTTFTSCSAAAYYFAQGGGIFTAGLLTLAHSTLSGNHADGNGGTYGGGLRAGSAVVRYSTIHANYLGDGPHGFGGKSQGGGMFIYQGATDIKNSTIDSNFANGNGGGIFGVHSNITIANSTISGNFASGNGTIVASSGGGIGMLATPGAAATLKISNSTIVFNTAATSAGGYGGGGIRAYGTAVIQSSILANNFKFGQPNDFSCECGIATAPTISGSENLIMALDPGGTPPPNNFITRTLDPKLAPFSNHGGETAVYALSSKSIAIGLGNNSGNFLTDQRGFGFPRENAGKTDIGAYQRQQLDDELFFDGFGEP